MDDIDNLTENVDKLSRFFGDFFIRQFSYQISNFEKTRQVKVRLALPNKNVNKVSRFFRHFIYQIRILKKLGELKES